MGLQLGVVRALEGASDSRRGRGCGSVHGARTAAMAGDGGRQRDGAATSRQRDKGERREEGELTMEP